MSALWISFLREPWLDYSIILPQMSYIGNGSGSRAQSVRRQQDNIYGRRAPPKSGNSRRHAAVEQGLLKRILIGRLKDGWKSFVSLPKADKLMHCLSNMLAYKQFRTIHSLKIVIWSSSSERSRCTPSVCMTTSTNSRNNSTHNICSPFRDLAYSTFLWWNNYEWKIPQTKLFQEALLWKIHCTKNVCGN